MGPVILLRIVVARYTQLFTTVPGARSDKNDLRRSGRVVRLRLLALISKVTQICCRSFAMNYEQNIVHRCPYPDETRFLVEFVPLKEPPTRVIVHFSRFERISLLHNIRSSFESICLTFTFCKFRNFISKVYRRPYGYLSKYSNAYKDREYIN